MSFLFYYIARLLCIFLAKCFYRHKVYGKEHLREGKGIIAANHVSFLDPVLIGIATRYRIHFLARSSLFHNKLFGWILKNLNVHPINKTKQNEHRAIFTEIISLLHQDKKLLIFPEGTRSIDGSIQKGETGIGMIVSKTGCSIIPTYVAGSFEIWPSQKKLPSLKGRTACIFGSPIDCSLLDPSLSKKENYEKIVANILNKIAQLKDWYENDRSGTPP